MVSWVPPAPGQRLTPRVVPAAAAAAPAGRGRGGGQGLTT